MPTLTVRPTIDIGSSGKRRDEFNRLLTQPVADGFPGGKSNLMASLLQEDLEEGPKLGPPQPPAEELYGTTIIREHIEGMKRDTLGREIFSLQARLAQFDEDAAEHEQNRAAPLPVTGWEPGLYILTADMGDGKTLYVTHITRAFYRAGWNVYSTSSLLFGQRMAPEQAYAFPDFVEPGSVVFVDEIHVLVERYAGNATRQRTWAQAMTALRKEGVVVFGASAYEELIGYEAKMSAAAVGYPQRWYPQDPMTAPPWCYVTIGWWGPRPWRNETLGEREGIVRRGRKRKHWVTPNPYGLYQDARTFDSWERVDIGAGMAVTAEVMRGVLNGGQAGSPAKAGPEEIAALIDVMHEQGRFRAYAEARDAAGRKVPLEYIQQMIQGSGPPASIAAIRATLASYGVRTQQRTVDLDQLDRFVAEAAE